MKKYYLLIMAVIAAVLVYSVFTYLKSGIQEEGLVVCEQGKCYWAPGDIHTQLEISICGKPFHLPLDTGATDMPHTHKERDLLHFEGRLEVDPETREVIDETPLMLKKFFDIANIRFTHDCIADKCNNDLCNGNHGKLTMRVNTNTNNEFEDYVWKDDDHIEITFE